MAVNSTNHISENILQKIIDGVHQPMFLIGGDFELLIWNKPAEKILELIAGKVEIKTNQKIFNSKSNPNGNAFHHFLLQARKKELHRELVNYPDNLNPTHFQFDSQKILLPAGAAGLLITVQHQLNINELNEENHLFRQMYENAFDGMVVLDNKGVILNVNKRFEELSGYTKPELIGNNVLDLIIAKEDHALQLQRLRDREQGKSETYEIEYVTKQGKKWIAKVKASPFYNLNDKTSGVIAAVEDISQLKKEETEKLNLQLHNDFLMEVASEAIIHHDKGIILDVNPAFERMTGYSRKEAIGKSLLLFTPPEHHEKLKENFLKTEPLNYESYFYTRQGEKRIIQIDVKNVNYQGKETRVVTVYDITDTKKAEQSLIESELLFRNLVENTDDIITLFEPESRKRKYVNKSFYRVLGYNQEEAFNIKGFSLVHPDDFDFVIKNYNEVLQEQNASRRFTYKMCHKNGSYVDVETIATNLSHIKGIEGILLIGRDISDQRKMEVELKESEERFRYFMEVAREGILIYHNGKIIDFNDTLLQMFGYSASELKGKSLITLFNQLAENTILSLEQRTFVSRELTGVKKDGTEFDVQINARKHTYKETEVTVIAFNDITQRKEVERELDKSRERLEAAVNNTGIGIWDWNLVSNQVYYSDTWMKMFGYLPGELSYNFETWETSVHPDDLAIAKQDLENHFAGLTRFYYNIHRSKHKDGHWVWIEAKGKMILDEHGNKIRMVGTNIDISDRIKINENLQHTLAYKASVIENRLEFIWMVDTQFRLIDSNKVFNDEFEKLFGYKPVQGEIIFKDASSSLRKIWITRYKRCLKGESIKEIDELNLKGNTTYIESSLNPIYTSDKEIIGVAVITRNITEQKIFEKKLEEAKAVAEQANQTKSQFMATMSHELRTPINGIIGFTDLALKTELNSEQQGDLQLVKYSAQNLLRLIDDLLDISKIETGNMNLVNISFSLYKLLNELLNAEKVSAQQNNLELILEFDQQIPEMIIGDEVRLNQVLSNLSNNSIKFSKNAPIYIRAKLKSKADNRVSISFEVEDEGIGIPEDKQKMIFEPFIQGESSYNRQFGGTGLGLAISKKLVNMLGGDLKLNSEPGRGSIFFFDLEFLLPEKRINSANTTSGGTGVEILNEISGLKILVAEDNEINRILVERILLLHKCEVRSAVNGIEALELWKQEYFDLILLDIEMPGMDGIEVTRMIREHELISGKHIPIIAVTAHALKGDREKFLNAGMDEYITKPITMSALFHSIKSLLEKKSVQP